MNTYIAHLFCKQQCIYKIKLTCAKAVQTADVATINRLWSNHSSAASRQPLSYIILAMSKLQNKRKLNVNNDQLCNRANYYNIIYINTKLTYSGHFRCLKILFGTFTLRIDTLRGFLIELKYFSSCTYLMHMSYLQQSLRTFRRI